MGNMLIWSQIIEAVFVRNDKSEYVTERDLEWFLWLTYRNALFNMTHTFTAFTCLPSCFYVIVIPTPFPDKNNDSLVDILNKSNVA